MPDLGRCPFYRDSVSLSRGRGLGHCDLEGGEAICEGDFQCCDKPDALRKQLLEQKKKEIRNNEREEDQKKKPVQYKVLVVDDQEQMRKLIIELLSQQGHQCVTAADGVEAMSKIYQNRFDAVITDIVMPKMNGIALTKEILSVYPKLPIIVMTGHVKEHPTELAIAAGAREFIEKPFSYDEFILRFNKMMGDHEILCQMEAKQNEILLHSRKNL